jgi:ATP-dependent DNA helicase DinG
MIKSCFDNNQCCIAEAPCGTGKSFAYLIPAIVNAINKNQKTVVATANIFLQEQLYEIDLPFLQSVVDSDFSYCLIKGRSNYVCKLSLDKMNELNDRYTKKLRSEDKSMADKLLKWANETTTGDKSEFDHEPPPYVWELFSVSDEDCVHKHCEHYDTCFSQRARKAAKDCDIIVCNYHILLFDLKRKKDLGIDDNSNGILPQFNCLVLDEAHKLEEISRNFFGEEVSEYSCRRVLKSLEGLGSDVKWLEKKLRDLEAKVFLQDYEEDEDHKEVINRLYTYDEASKLAEKGKKLHAKLTKSYVELFQNIKKYYEAHAKDYVRTKEKNIVGIANVCNDLDYACDILKEWAFFLDKVQKKGDAQLFRQRKREAFELGKRIRKLVEQSDNGFVYWIEASKDRPTKIQGTPIEVSEYLNKYIWTPIDSSILVSGTIATGNSLKPEELINEEIKYRALLDRFSFNINALGLNERNPNMFICESPFDFGQNCALVICQNFPKPQKEEQAYRETFLAEIQKAVIDAGGGALILFTSYDHMEYFFNNCDLLKSKFNVFAQVFSQINRKTLVNHFKKDPNSVLLGAASFWEGLDVPGDALRLLVIDKMPFPNKSQDPFLDAMESKNKEFFKEEYLPRALIRLKQGVGRLIRKKTDRGMIVIADSRCYPGHSPYANNVFKTMPPMRYAPHLGVVKPYFDDLNMQGKSS